MLKPQACTLRRQWEKGQDHVATKKKRKHMKIELKMAAGF